MMNDNRDPCTMKGDGSVVIRAGGNLFIKLIIGEDFPDFKSFVD